MNGFGTRRQTKKAGVKKRSLIRQSDLPSHSLREALTVAQALTDGFAGDPTSPHQVAMALDISPTSSIWRSLPGAAVAYGLTKGGYKADKISLEELGRRCTAPTEEGDDTRARAEAVLKPTVPKGFFEKYNKSKFPSDAIAKNVLSQEFDVPSARTAEVLQQLKEDGTFVGFIHETKTGPFVSIDDLKPAPVTVLEDQEEEEGETPDSDEPLSRSSEGEPFAPEQVKSPEPELPFKVFITHGKNTKILDQVKDVLDLYDIEYEVAVEEESAAIPVPQKVLQAMRHCSAGVMIVSADDDQAAEKGTINNNVLIEIGAAFVLYDQKVVLLWDKNLKVPSNLQGLYRCEFEGTELTFSSGTKLAKAVKGFKS